VRCRNCGLRYVGWRRSQLTFGSGGGDSTEVASRVQAANFNIRNLRLEEEHRLGILNARWRLDLIRNFRTSGRLLEVGCARGDFLRVARESFDVSGVEPNPSLADDAEKVAPIYRDVIETLPWHDFDVITSFHVIEHVDSPKRFVAAMADRIKSGGLLVLETPDINSLPFQLMKRRWRQFIPEHYFFFDPSTMTRLLSDSGFKVERIVRIGKHASAALILNRMSRYFPFMRPVEDFAGRLGISRITVRINPLDIMLVFAVRA
jgi:2-polyprenyl-3-methyl-5-hydroxy-6-metoxy-1,4-benzoquinol methylase